MGAAVEITLQNHLRGDLIYNRTHLTRIFTGGVERSLRCHSR
jgi:hypothetical protein